MNDIRFLGFPMSAASLTVPVASHSFHTAQYQVGASASAAPNASAGNATPTPSAPFGSSAVVATSTGTQPGGVSGNAFSALQTQNPGAGTDTTTRPATSQDLATDPATQQAALVAVQQLFQSNVATLSPSDQSSQAAVNLVS
jgi:hypothetical protein